MAAFSNLGTTTSYYSTAASCGNCNCPTGECQRVRQRLPSSWYVWSDAPEPNAVRIPAPTLRPTPRRVTSVARAANLIPSHGEPGTPGRAELPQATPAPAAPPEAPAGWGAALRAWDKR